jgi:hypothetical protein
MAMAGLWTKNNCAGEDQQEFTRQKELNYNGARTPPLDEEVVPLLNTYIH